MKTITLLSLMLLGFTTANSQVIDDYNLLMLKGGGSENVKEHLEILGHTVTIKKHRDLEEGFDYSDYDAILLPGKDEVIPGLSEIIALNEQGELGIVLLRGNRTINGALGFLGNAYSARGEFHITNNTHYITQPFEEGELDLGMSNVATIELDHRYLENKTTLGKTKSGKRSLITHNNYRRVFSPFTGMDSDGENPISEDGLELFDRIIAWAVFNPSLGIKNYSGHSAVKCYPNPSHDSIYFSGLNKAEDFKIFSNLGIEVKSGTVSNKQGVIIKSLSKGMYYIRFENGVTMKLIKN